MRVALVVDNPLRDLPGIVLLGVTLCHHGVTCYLVPQNLAFRELCALAPDFALLNYLRTANEEIAGVLLDAGIGVGVLDTEGGVFPSFDSYAATIARSSGVRSGVDCYCAWGCKLASYLVKHGWYRSAQVVVTGAPRFDFYAAPWRAAALQLSSGHIGECASPVVLMNGSFALANPLFTSPDEEARLWAKFGHDLGEVVRWQQGQARTMACFAELANSLAARFTDVTFIYRPHPFERPETYHGLLECRQNLRLSRVGTVDGWILRASAVIQHGSSTAVEAGIAGVPALFPAWIPTPVPLHVPEVVSVHCRSESDLAEHLKLALAGRSAELMATIESGLRDVVRDWFCASDGEAHNRVARAILDRVSPTPVKGRLRTCQRAYYSGIPMSIRSRITGRVRSALGLPPDWSFRRWRRLAVERTVWDRSLKRFVASEVSQIVAAIEAVWPSPPLTHVNVRPAQQGRDYYFDYPGGRSVVLEPADA